MSDKILKLINNDKWESAFKKLDNMFETLYNEKTLFHYACMRGNELIINKYLDSNSDEIYLSDNDGNTGIHLLAYTEWDELLINIVKKYPKFLKLKNFSDYFIYDIVKERVKTLKSILMIMIENKMTKYFDFIKNSDRTFFLDIIDISENNDEYIEILELLINSGINQNIPRNIPPLIYSLLEKFNKVTNFLIKNNKIDINVNNDLQINPLIIAIQQKNQELINKLLKLNIDINYSGFESKNVPLSLCFKYGLIDSAKNMIKNTSLDFNKKDSYLNTPIYYLIYFIVKNNSTMSKEQQKECFDILKILIKNSDLNNLNIENKTPLHLLTKYKLWHDYKDILKDKNININVISKDSETPISSLSEEEFSDLKKIINENYQTKNEDYSKIVLPKVLSNGDFGLFNADGIHNMLYIFVMLKKYKNLKIPTQQKIDEKRKWNIYKLSSHVQISDPVMNLLHSLVSLYEDTFFKIVPSIILWNNKNVFFECGDTIYLEKLINDPLEKSRFIMMRITLILDNQSLHANILLYDKKLNKIIRFEPYGDWEFNDSYNLDNLITKIFKKSLGSEKSKTLKYIRPSDFLDKTKFQTTSLGDNFSSKNLGDPVGYCLAWCFWFLELKLLNPDFDDHELVNKTLSKIIQENNKTENPLLTHIRSYAKNLDFEKNKLLETIGFKNTESYKLSFSDEKIEKIKNYINNYKF